MTGPSSPDPVPAAPAPPPPGGGRNLTRWVTAGWIVIVIIVTVVSILGDRLNPGGSRPAVSLPAREPPHIVVYRFTAVGTANEDIEISYTGADGEEEKLSLPGIVPGWRQEVRTEPGLPYLSFNVRAHSSDLNYSLRCAIEIDGYTEDTTQGLSCNMVVNFPRPSRERRRVTPPPTALRTQPAPVAGCGLVTSPEVTIIVLHATGGVFKSVLAMEGEARKCRYWIDVERGYIEYEWTPGRKQSGIPAGLRVREVDVPAYWFAYGERRGRLFMYVRGGELRVDVNFELLEIRAKQAALEFADKARPRLR
jgi:hypothetical protein